VLLCLRASVDLTTEIENKLILCNIAIKGHVCWDDVFSYYDLLMSVRFVVYCTCAKYRVVEYYRVCRIRDVILEYAFLNYRDDRV
jgi:hypothetical protein